MATLLVKVRMTSKIDAHNEKQRKRNLDIKVVCIEIRI